MTSLYICTMFKKKSIKSPNVIEIFTSAIEEVSLKVNSLKMSIV